MRRIVALIARGPASSLSALGRLRDVRYPRANAPSAAALSSFVDLRRFPLGSDFTALNLATADRIADGVVLEAERRKFQPVSVVVCDPAGRVIVSKRMDGCANLIPASAEAKAVSSVAMNRSSRSLRDGYSDRQAQLSAMGDIATSKLGIGLAPFPGGVLLMTHGSAEEAPRVVGAVGVSGASADEDEHCALQGAHTVGFLTDPPVGALNPFED